MLGPACGKAEKNLVLTHSAPHFTLNSGDHVLSGGTQRNAFVLKPKQRNENIFFLYLISSNGKRTPQYSQ